MGESAMLLRSFSHPSDASREAKEGDPIRALTESISFGRFMSESLAWEKWSTFSHNRYLEEVERFSKPGSVAEKKAYFEAHYKRKAAMRAAALAEEANAAATAELKTTSDIQNDSPMDTESANANGHVVINEQKQENMVNSDNDFPNNMELGNTNSKVDIDKEWEENKPDNEAADSANADACHSINITEDLGYADMERDEALMEYAVDVENLTQADHSKQLQSAEHDKIVATTIEETSNKEAIDQENSAPSCKKRQANSSSRSSTRSGASRLPLYPAKQAPFLSPTNVNNVSTNSKKCVGDLNEKRRKIPKTLHMSINFSSRSNETSKASSKILGDSSTSIPTPTKAAVKGVSKHLSKIFQSEDNRNKALVAKSISGGITEDRKSHSPMDHSKSSSANGTKTQTPNKSSPFSLRSEERAAKRKEFFQKLEEKNNFKEAEKTQLKGKAEHDPKKLRQSTVLKTKQNEYLYHGSPSPSNHMKKEKGEQEIENLRPSTGFKAKSNDDFQRGGSPSLSTRMKKILGTQPWSPKLGRKPTSTTVQQTCSRPPRRPSTNTENPEHVTDKSNRSTSHSVTSLPKHGRRPTPNTFQDTSTRPPWRSSMSTASVKRVMEKNNQSTTRSVTSLPKKNSHENASPNIQS